MNTKNYAIEFWRFVFTMFVVMGHLEVSTVLTGETFRNGGMGVDFFFVLSGFLLYQGYQKKWKREDSALGYTTNLMRRRIARFAPVYYICFAVGAGYHIWIYSMYTDKTAMDILNFEKGLWSELVFLNSIFFHPDSANSATWYISALLIGTLLLTLVLTITDKVKIKSWVIVLGVFATCFYLHFFGGVGASVSRITRALYGLALGGICWILTAEIGKMQMNHWKKGCVSLIEIICIIGIAYCMFFYRGSLEIRIPLLFFYGGLIMVSFLQNSVIAVLMNRRVFAFLGTISYAIYASHLQVLMKFGWLPGFDLLANKAYSYTVILAVIIGWGTFVNYLPKIIKKAYVWLYGLVHAKDTIKYIRYGEME